VCSPSSGAGRVTAAGVAENRIGQPRLLTGPACGCVV